MRRSLAPILVILTLALALPGCGAEPTVEPETAVTAVSTVAPPETDSPDAETASAEVPSAAATEEAETEPPQESAVPEFSGEAVPYTQSIKRSDHPIYSGPGYDYDSAGTVRKQGIYTIVEEAVDGEGNLWGRLKSGAGWVDLTKIRSEAYQNALISANYADEELLLSGRYHHFSVQREYSIPVAFRAYGTLQDVTLFEVGFGEKGYFQREELYTLSEMDEALPLVAELDFPGEASLYGIRFADEEGNAYTYIIYTSGRNGALELEEQEIG